MNRYFNAGLGAGALLMLAACGSSNDIPEPEVKVTELAAGVYAVSSGDANNPTAGKYYAASDGSRLLVLNNSATQASSLYRREGNGKWQMTPSATQNTSLELLNSSATTSAALNLTAVARSYTVRLSNGAAAAFTISSAGDIVAGGTSCKLSGKLSASTLPNTLKASLTASSCGDLPAQSEGYLVSDSDYAPATFRLLTYSGSTLVDLWAYAE
jgi:hypothetical protein